jgi:hypothetical protein
VTVTDSDDLLTRLDGDQRLNAAKKKPRKGSKELSGEIQKHLEQQQYLRLKRIELQGVMKKYEQAEEIARVDAKIVNVEFEDAYRELRKVMLGFYFTSMKD